MQKKRFKLIACEILFREVCHCASLCAPVIDVTFMRKGLHDVGETLMKKTLQDEIDKTDAEKYDAVLLGYGLCNNGVRGLRANLPLVIPKAHDCITLLLGSRERYSDYFYSNPGTYYESSGWLERGLDADRNDGSIFNQLGGLSTSADYAELYGEENAEYLAEILGNMLNNYKKVTYINTGLGAVEADRETARENAGAKGFEFEEIQGDIGLIYRLLGGDWDESEFLVVPPGCEVCPSNDSGVLCCKCCEK